MVYGYASTEALDSQGEIVVKKAIEEALPDYMKFGNIREMHTTSAVGKAHEATIDDKGLWLGVKVVDENAWQKVKEGVYNGFSIGGKIITKINDTITQLRLTEISLVDRPANPEAVFAFYKGDGMGDENLKEDQIKDDEVEVIKADKVDEEDKKEPKKSKGDDKEKEPKEDDEEVEGKKETKKSEEPEIKKGMYTVSRLAELIQELSYIQDSTEWEAESEGDGSTLPSELKEQIRGLIGVFTNMVAEETSELLVEKSEVNADIAKAGASISKTNKAKLQAIIDSCKEMMGDEEAEKADNELDMTKGEDISKAYDMVKSELDMAKGEISKMATRITELEAMPEVPKGALMSLGKSADYEGGQEVSKAVVVDAKGEVNEVASMIKSIQSQKIQ